MCDLQVMLNRIKYEKKKSGFTNQTLSEATHIPKATLEKVLAGIIKEPSVTTIIKIAKVLNVSTDYLIYGCENTKNMPPILNKYNSLNTLGKNKANSYIDDLCEQEKYTKNIITENISSNCNALPREIAAFGAKGTKGTYKKSKREIT